jgi:hypothetical protein
MKRRHCAFLALLALGACASEEQQKADQIKKAVADEFKDPSSAQFRNLKLVGVSLCGEVNAKNSYAAYTGFERFDATGPGGVTLESKSRRKCRAVQKCEPVLRRETRAIQNRL